MEMLPPVLAAGVAAAKTGKHDRGNKAGRMAAGCGGKGNPVPKK